MLAVKLVKPFADQKPGTSGLRKKVTHFFQPHYLESFIQSTFNALKTTAAGVPETLVVGGDGRYKTTEAIQTIIQMAAATGVVRNVMVGQHGYLSTPAASATIRQYKAGGGFLLTASHNPGGPNGDFGVKYNAGNGGPAPESLTNLIYQATSELQEYYIMSEGLPSGGIDLSTVGSTDYTLGGDTKFTVTVFDSVEVYCNLLQNEVFDFDAIKQLLKRKDFSFVFDGMHGISGPYAERILVGELGADPSSLINCKPSPDFNGGHPDPNLTYASELVKRMGLQAEGTPLLGVESAACPAFGAACDGDADRNMILGCQFFVSPSDSLAVLALNSHAIPFFQKNGPLKALARSMPTSAAVDRVAKKLNIPLFEVPTGWKFFGNLMDAAALFNSPQDYNPLICGEESFGTSSNHVREKDGLWAVLAWLSILAVRNNKQGAADALIGVDTVVKEFWQEFGRLLYTRYDYEEVDAEKANAMIAHLSTIQDIFNKDPNSTDPKVKALQEFNGVCKKIRTADQFCYIDPIDNSESKNQGLRFIYEDGSRFIFRLSGTGSAGATIRMYIECESGATETAATTLSNAIAFALNFSQLQHFTGREKPTVIT